MRVASAGRVCGPSMNSPASRSARAVSRASTFSASGFFPGRALRELPVAGGILAHREAEGPLVERELADVVGVEQGHLFFAPGGGVAGEFFQEVRGDAAYLGAPSTRAIKPLAFFADRDPARAGAATELGREQRLVQAELVVRRVGGRGERQGFQRRGGSEEIVDSWLPWPGSRRVFPGTSGRLSSGKDEADSSRGGSPGR